MEVTTEQLLQMIGAKQVAIELSLQPKLARALAELDEWRSKPCLLKHCSCEQDLSDPGLD